MSEDDGLPFVPRVNGTADRYDFRLSIEDRHRFRDLPYRSRRWIEITDQRTGTKYLVRRASCGSGCYCDALAKPLPEVKP